VRCPADSESPFQKKKTKKQISGVGWFLERKEKEGSLNLMELRAGGVDSKKKKTQLTDSVFQEPALPGYSHPTALTPALTGSASLGATRAFSTQTRVTGLSR
jgi:hypothetical protein